MFGIGMPEMILILAVALIVIGPKKLPDLAKSLGKAMGEFKKAASDLKESMQIDTELKDLKTSFDNLNQEDKTADRPKTDQTEDKPVGAAEAVPPADAGAATDSAGSAMDDLKAAFDRRHKGDSTAETSLATGDVEPPVEAEATHPKDV
jgi:Tat protein translocase TatB subunit